VQGRHVAAQPKQQNTRHWVVTPESIAIHGSAINFAQKINTPCNQTVTPALIAANRRCRFAFRPNWNDEQVRRQNRASFLRLKHFRPRRNHQGKGRKMKILILTLLTASVAVFSTLLYTLLTICGTVYRTLVLGQTEEEQLREKPKK
jgi:hypothetical protein